jgi:hypothetical protein
MVIGGLAVTVLLLTGISLLVGSRIGSLAARVRGGAGDRRRRGGGGGGFMSLWAEAEPGQAEEVKTTVEL